MLSSVTQGWRASTAHWLSRRITAHGGEVTLSQRRVFILPTRAGLGFALLLALLFIGSLNYNLAMGYALTFVLAACAMVDMHMCFRNLAYLRVSSGRALPAHVGEQLRFELQLANPGRHERYAIRIGFAGADWALRAQALDIPAEGSRQVVLEAPARQRGWLGAPRVRLQTSFPLGLLQAWSNWQPDSRALAYPRPEARPAPLPAADAEREDEHGSGGQDDFAGVRAYQPGDSPRRLAWRHIARLGENGILISKHFEGGAASELRLDYALLPAGMEIEARLSRMTRWIIEAEARGLPYAFYLGDTRRAAALGGAHREDCLRALALYGKPA
jgi:uncharacterized protein (DUF58 family)